MPKLYEALSGILNGGKVIALEPFIIRSIGPLTGEWLELLKIVPAYICVAPSSYIILNENGTTESSGMAKLCRPGFELASDMINYYFSLVYAGQSSIFHMPDIKLIPREKFVLTMKIKDIELLAPDSIKYKLALQHGTSITTWISAKYLMTMRGPILLSKIESNDVLDYSYYMDELNKYRTNLQSLKSYGL